MVQRGLHVNPYITGPVRESEDLMVRRCGIKVVRTEHGFEHEDGHLPGWFTPACDRLASLGRTVLVTRVRKDGDEQKGREQLVTLRRAYNRALKTYAGTIRTAKIINVLDNEIGFGADSDRPNWTDKDYVARLKTEQEARRQMFPGIPILGPALGSFWEPGMDFLTELGYRGDSLNIAYESGFFEKGDPIAINQYGPNSIKLIAAAASIWEWGFDIAVTEFGGLDHGGPASAEIWEEIKNLDLPFACYFDSYDASTKKDRLMNSDGRWLKNARPLVRAWSSASVKPYGGTWAQTV